MTKIKLFNDDCISVIKSLPEKSVDLIFADPPYNLSGNGFVTTQSGKKVELNKGDWDIIEDIHEFNYTWLKECLRVLTDTGTIWISGTLHNHPSIGVTLKKLGYWIINDVIWYKRNATPLLAANRLAPSTELIWVASRSKKFKFNYNVGKQLNGGKQMRNMWEINAERHKTAHPTEKPETLLERILLLGSDEGQLILDPFMGSGTTGVVARNLNRAFIGIELDKNYYEIAENRIRKKQGVEYNLKIDKGQQTLALEKESKGKYKKA